MVGKNYLVYASEIDVSDFVTDGLFWYGWTDVLPVGTKMMIPAGCSPGGETSTVRKVVRQLGKGHAPVNR